MTVKDNVQVPEEGVELSKAASTPGVHQTLAGNTIDLDETTLQRVESAWAETLAVASPEEVTIATSFSPPMQEGTRFSTIAEALCLRKYAVTEEADHGESPHFRLSRKIGEGGMGVVYEACQTSVDRTIALKRMKEKSQSGTVCEGKFLSEAIATAELDHPNIIPIYDLGRDTSDHLFYAMKRIRGEAWSETMASNSLEDNLRILLDVCDAIAYAHSKGVIHRDLKPENVMVGPFGEVVVMDWGLAISVDERGKAERIQLDTPVAGTPAYMAPEMARGDNNQIGCCSDIYLLGAILYEILEGRPPHHGVSVMSCVRNAACNSILQPKNQGELMDVACRAMASDPARRHRTVKELQEAIRTWQSHAESLVLTRSAAEALAGAHRGGAHAEYARAMFTFEEALRLWPDNPAAGTQAREARLAYAESAIAKEDLALASDLLNAEALRATPTGERLVEAQGKAAQRSRHMRLLTCIVPAMIFAIGISLYSTYVKIREEKARTESARLESRNLLEKILPLMAAKHREAVAPSSPIYGGLRYQGVGRGHRPAGQTTTGVLNKGLRLERPDAGDESGMPTDGGAANQATIKESAATAKDPQEASVAYIRILSHLGRHQEAVSAAKELHAVALKQYPAGHPLAQKRLNTLNRVRGEAGLKPLVPTTPAPVIRPATAPGK